MSRDDIFRLIVGISIAALFLVLIVQTVLYDHLARG